METAKNVYQKYCTVGFDEAGVLNRFEIHCPDNFNFAYDVIDRITKLDPAGAPWSGPTSPEQKRFLHSKI
jgi:hypothetical protein